MMLDMKERKVPDLRKNLHKGPMVKGGQSLCETECEQFHC